MTTKSFVLVFFFDGVSVGHLFDLFEGCVRKEGRFLLPFFRKSSCRAGNELNTLKSIDEYRYVTLCIYREEMRKKIVLNF